MSSSIEPLGTRYLDERPRRGLCLLGELAAKDAAEEAREDERLGHTVFHRATVASSSALSSPAARRSRGMFENVVGWPGTQLCSVCEPLRGPGVHTCL